MSMGKFITNMEKDCTTTKFSSCGTAPPPFTHLCAKHRPPSYWVDKEEGPTALSRSGSIVPDCVGIYEKQPGPVGTWAPGYGDPQKWGVPNTIANALNTNALKNPWPKITIPPYSLPKTWNTPSHSVPFGGTAPTSVASHATAVPTAGPVNGNVSKLKALREEDQNTIAKKFDPSCLLEPLGCRACGSQEKNRHKLMCPQDPARKKTNKWI